MTDLSSRLKAFEALASSPEV